jgi:exopolysaccharide biosynthesis polyprenyl glycosylphosphotransferase
MSSDHSFVVRDGHPAWLASERASHRARRYVRFVGTVDLCLAAAVAAQSFELRPATDSRAAALVFALALPLLWVAALRFAGSYKRDFIGVGPDEFRTVLTAGAGLAAAIIIFSYAIGDKLAHASILIAMPEVILLCLLTRYLARKRLDRLRERGLFMSTVALVGHEQAVRQLASELRRSVSHGLHPVCCCLVNSPHTQEVDGIPVLGDFNDVASVSRNLNLDMVVILAGPEIDGHKIRDLAWQLEMTGTGLCVSTPLIDVGAGRTKVRSVAGATLVEVSHTRLSGGRLFLKSVFDKCAAAAALFLLAPLLVAIALIIKISDHGPALFTQVRIGKDGQPFKIYKFRTMVTDAEARLSAIRAANEFDGVLFKIRRDPRVTRVGAILRKRSLDELPTLFNVLRGDMSLVGPRPALPDEAAVYADHVRRRLTVKPGVTGLWQVNGRSDLSWDESVRLDLRYVENWSLVLDLQILWETISVLVRASGAY